MPRQHDLAREHSVSFSTLKQALDLIEQEGYVVRKLGQGTYASLPEPHEPMALVVDDHPAVREFLGEALKLAGWRSFAVETGRRALEAVQDRRFDLIFLDLVMPGMDGVDTFREISKIAPGANVVIITAHHESGLLSEALRVGPFAVLRKPFALEELHQVLRNVAGAVAVRTTGRQTR